MLKIATIVGARPQFVKAAVVSRAIEYHNKSTLEDAIRIEEIIIHTGQHYDDNMSDIFFDEMHIPPPKYHLGVKDLSHGAMTGRMLEKLEEMLQKENPDIVLVYGDTNSTLAGALAAAKLHLPVVHVEAGLRSFNRLMPEEINRVLTDHVSTVLFCPTKQAVKNLKKEGIETDQVKHKKKGGVNRNKHYKIKLNNPSKFTPQMIKSTPSVILVGDVMLDAAMYYKQYSQKPVFDIPPEFVLVTIHRAENTDDPARLKSIFSALRKIGREMPVIIPLHPRSLPLVKTLKISIDNMRIVDPVGYLTMVYLLERCTLVMTDSGGLQKEAYFFKKPCITLRDETEWVELVENDFNCIVGADEQKIYEGFKNSLKKSLNFDLKLYGEGDSGDKIVRFLLRYMKCPQ
jgi:UDP-GlcNAc3NAcA epimerase